MNYLGDPGRIEKSCKCGERYMSVCLGDTSFIENDRLSENLIHFVNSCECMNKV